MAYSLPPPPVGEKIDSPAFRDWFYKLKQYLDIGFSADWSQIVLPEVDANNVFIGPTSGSPATAAFRPLVSADLPNKTATYVAGETLGGDRLVYIDSSGQAKYASNDVLSNTNIVLGITVGAASIGTNVEIQLEGEYEEPSWSWTLEQPIFLGNNGLLTQTQPTAPAFSLVIGFPITSTKILLRFNNPIVLT